MTGGPWLVLALLGAGHGLNPGMGWLFAVALGLQEGRGAAVWRALGPLTVGHAAAVALAAAAALALGTMLPESLMKWLVAALLLSFAVHRLVVNRHPRYGGMKVTGAELALWSLLMASAHGAGLMVVPVLLGMMPAEAPAHHVHHAAAAGPPGLTSGPALDALLATLAHTAGYLAVTGLLACLVYWKLGVGILRTAWINLDLLWAAALIVTAVVVVLV